MTDTSRPAAPAAPNEPASTAPLTWQDSFALAQALHRRDPKIDWLNITSDEVVALVTSLPNFAGGPTPPDDDTVEDIVSAWFQLDEGGDHGQWDPYV